MKKGLLLGVAILTSLLLLTGCKKDTNKLPIVEDEYTFNIVDKMKEYVVTFKQTDKQSYEPYSVDNYNYKFQMVTIKNEKFNILADLTIDTMTKDDYDNLKDYRKNLNGYNEYAWNSLLGYSYDGDSEDISFVILLDNSEEEKHIVLLGRLMPYEEEVETNVSEVFKGEDFQSLLNTVTFYKGK